MMLGVVTDDVPRARPSPKLFKELDDLRRVMDGQAVPSPPPGPSTAPRGVHPHQGGGVRVIPPQAVADAKVEKER